MCTLSACKDFQEYIYYDKGQHYKKSLKIPEGQLIIDSIISEVQDGDEEKCNSENELCVEYTSANAICLN
jgi:hypothetical protein